MRRTAKYDAALRTLSANKLTINGDLYATLAANQFAWNSEDQTWFKTKRPVDPTGREKASEFTDDENLPSGVVRLRLMGHPDDLKVLLPILKSALNMIEISEPYPNRGGAGVRIYTQAKLVKFSKRGRPARGQHESDI
jgi:hypothetical protein